MNPHGFPPGYPPGQGPPGYPPGQGPPGYGPPGYGPPGYGHQPGPPGHGHYPHGPPPKRSNTLIWVIAGLVATVFGGCMVCSAVTKSTAKGVAGDFVDDLEKNAEERREKRANPIETKVNKLIRAYEDDQEKADKKFKGEYVSFNSEIQSIEIESQYRVFLRFGDDDASTILRCRMASASKAADLSDGDEVSVRGQVDRLDKHRNFVELSDCEADKS